MSVIALVTPSAIAVLARSAAASAGDISTIAGTGAIGYLGDGVAATSARVYDPQGVTIDAHGNPLIADTNNNRVRVLAVSTSNPGYLLGGCTDICVWMVGDVYTIAGTGPAGYNGDGIPATDATLNFPAGIAVDAHGNPVIADSDNQRVRVVAVSTSNPGYPVPSWTVGDIYTVAGNGPGTVKYSGDGVLATVAPLFDPRDVTVDRGGDLLIADSGNARVRVVAVSTSNPGYLLAGCTGTCRWAAGNIYTIAGDGAPSYDGDGIAATGAALSFPAGVAVDGDENVLIADRDNNRVRIVAVSFSNPGYAVPSWTVGDIYTVAGNGTGSYTSDGFRAAATEVNEPSGVTVDGHHNPIIADNSNHRVRVIAVSSSNPGYLLGGCIGSCRWTVGDIYTIAGDGTGSYNGDGILATSAQLDFPSGVAIDTKGNFYVADSFNSRVREVQIGIAVTAPCAPRSVSATPIKDEAVVRWSAPSCSGGSAITNYLATPDLGSITLPARRFASTARTGVIVGLTVDKTYRFTVAAINVAGTSARSQPSNAVTIGVPGPPAKPTVATTALGSLKVSFNSPPNNGAAITHYTATCTSQNGGTTSINSTKASPINVDALTPGKTYTCSVTATNSRGTGPPSPRSASIVARRN
ncbi:MAG: fibronectin type III domain-containing protein [Acidimicrobiia bacterium]